MSAVASIGRGYDVAYMTKEVGRGREGYYLSATETAGEPAGLWRGAGAAELGLSGEVDADEMEAIYHRLVDPRDPEARLGKPNRSYKDVDTIYTELLANEINPSPERREELYRQAEHSVRQPLAFLDVTLSASKSISLLEVAYSRAAQEAARAGNFAEAKALQDQAAGVEAALQAGSDAMLAHLQDRAGLSRVGHHGGGAGRWIDSHKWVIASFLQHDSRNHDPQLHIHNAILNRQLGVDGKWRSLDSKAIHRERAAGGAIGERVAEATLSLTHGVRWEWRQDGKAREIVGVDQALCGWFSSRHRDLTARSRELISRFVELRGREPSPAERFKIMSQSTLGTRASKQHTGETIDQRLDRWAAEAKAETTAGLAAVLDGIREAAGRSREVPTWSPTDVMQRAVVLAAERKAAWTESDLIRAISDCLPADLATQPERVAPLFYELADQTLDRYAVRLTKPENTASLPAHLLREDGSSMYDGKTVYYAAPWQLTAEKALAERATATGAEAFTADEADKVIARERTLSPDQEQAIRGILTSGAYLEVLQAPPGTGKTFTLGIIAGAWTDQRLAPAAQPRRVFGLTTSQIAANVLAGEGVTAANITAWQLSQDRLEVGNGTATDQDWRLRADDLVVVDEASMVDIPALADIAERCERADARLVITGDPRQLGAVGAGGALGELFGKANTYELVEVRRFTAEWERTASLRLREGDTSVIAEYAAQGRLIDGGALEQTEDKAVRGWLNDHLLGKDAALVCGSNEQAARLNAAVRAELIELGRVSETGVVLGHSNELAGVGDIISARKNGRATTEFRGHTDPPVNRDQYKILAAHPDGSLQAARLLEHGQLGESVRLPASYVSQHVSLGYAGTAHSVQSRTLDTSHTVAKAGSDPAAVLVGATRGADCNTIYACTRDATEEQASGATNEVDRRTPESVMADAMTRREEVALTATVTAYRSAEEAASVKTNINRLSLELAEATAGRTSATLDRLVAEGRLSEHDRVALASDQRSMDMVDRLLRSHELAGHNREQLLIDAVASRNFTGARDPGAVLYSRLQAERHDLQPRLASFADLIPVGLDESTHARLSELAAAADERRAVLGARLGEHPPEWAIQALGERPDDAVAALEWEHKAGWAAASREHTGWTDATAQLGPDPGQASTETRAVWREAHAQLDLPDSRAEEAEMSVPQHRARVAAGRREGAWAPAFVDHETTATARTAVQDSQDAVIWGERKGPHTAAATEADQSAAAGWAKHSELSKARETRAAYLGETAVTMDKARRSEAHLRTLGVDPHNDPDRVSTEDWWAAREAELAESEPHREVTEADVHEDEDTAALPEPAGPETAVPDIRDTATRHPSEDTDAAPRDRVPEQAEVDDIAARAEEAAAEITARAEYTASREEMESTWHAEDTAAEQDDAADASVAD